MNIVASDREGGVKRNLIREELMIRREGGGDEYRQRGGITTAKMEWVDY